MNLGNKFLLQDLPYYAGPAWNLDENSRLWCRLFDYNFSKRDDAKRPFKDWQNMLCDAFNSNENPAVRTMLKKLFLNKWTRS